MIPNAKVKLFKARLISFKHGSAVSLCIHTQLDVVMCSDFRMVVMWGADQLSCGKARGNNAASRLFERRTRKSKRLLDF
ncbi:hypothetical protein LSTR_LSTR002290 [Laodelphax striatellus]|uniref:Uncharacterized protein n=1 Tax=Laodelphax striatellus TaxID=195883 RepID=A0A482XFK2_LAOST|nr:hypothetical protein LSTR_LSTR002290 [Laodelphax striatellus]